MKNNYDTVPVDSLEKFKPYNLSTSFSKMKNNYDTVPVAS